VQDIEALRDRVSGRSDASLYVYYPANLIAPANDTAVAGLFAKLRYADRNVRLDVGQAGEWTGITLMRPAIFVRFLDALLEGNVAQFMTANASAIAPIENKIGLIDLRVYATFIEYLTSNFEVRHFNSILPSDRYTLVKRSHNKDKIRSEFQYFGRLPEHLKRFFIQPFDYRETQDAASYSMERILIPDMALQWIHGSLTPAEFDSFLDQLFHYIVLRSSKSTATAEARRSAASLYLDKLDARMLQLKALPLFPQLDGLVSTLGITGGLAGLVKRFTVLYERLEPRREYGDLVLGHGDLCFSNILYDKNTRVIKFIDPRGFAEGENPYADPYYDLAKLSHSIVGLYDYINNGLFTISLTGNLALDLQCDVADRRAEQGLFRQRLVANGFDFRLTRLYEASLFLSMLPLHSEGPRKLAAFTLTAARILDELESTS